ncbi:cell adhesion molecule 1a isoform X1 [Tachysurus ichikawai]
MYPWSCAALDRILQSRYTSISQYTHRKHVGFVQHSQPLMAHSWGSSKVEPTYDRMYTVTSWVRLTVTKEDDGVPVLCIVDHPAVKDFQAQKFLEVQYKPEVKIVVEFPQGLTREGENLELTCKTKGKPE